VTPRCGTCTPETTGILLHLVSDPYILSDEVRIMFLAKIEKTIPKEDWHAVQQMMRTSTSEAFPKETSAVGIISRLPYRQWLLSKIAQKATKSRMHTSNHIWKALSDLLEQWLLSTALLLCEGCKLMAWAPTVALW
jgi:hypothetical protein